MSKLQGGKNFIVVGVIVLIGILVSISPLRYKITGTNIGYIYKTDRLTGKTWVVTPKGEVEIGSYNKPTPTTPPQQFPLYNLQILSTKGRTSGYNQFGDITIKNNDTKTASNIRYKITYSKTKNGDTYDTEYKNTSKDISGGDTITDTVVLNNSDNQYWWNISIISAEYK